MPGRAPSSHEHAWVIVASATFGTAARCLCGATAALDATEIAAAKILWASRGAAASGSLLNAMLDRKAEVIRSVEDD